MEYLLSLQRLSFFYPEHGVELLRAAGSAAEVYASRHDLCMSLGLPPGLTRNIMGDWQKTLRWAGDELRWCEKNRIETIAYGSERYPHNLMSCADAPLALFYRGTTELNSPHIVSVVGTRDASPYGRDITRALVSRLRQLVPDTLVVSGLAYGIDVIAHKAALEAGADTVGVLAHGLDTIYPAAHRSVARDIISHGGLLTEYPSKTRGDRQNFLHRNRIVAGMADCTVVVESKIHGGSLVTARQAGEYGREVYAFPARVGDITSEGCNNIIRDNKARLITSADDLVSLMGWHTTEEADKQRAKGIVPSLFPDLSPEQQTIVEALREGDMQQNALATKLHMPIGQVSALLFEMEMEGIVRPLAGGVYHLVTGV
ncbi:MAG: DNA-processing protein DprA [Prevotella sp.]